MTDKQNILMIFALLALCMPMIGCLFGLIRYKKHGKEIKEKMEKEYRQAQAKGGLSSLYYKRVNQRVFKRTFGLPMIYRFIYQHSYAVYNFYFGII